MAAAFCNTNSYEEGGLLRGHASLIYYRSFTYLIVLHTYNLTVAVRAAALLAEDRSTIGADYCVICAESIRRCCCKHKCQCNNFFHFVFSLIRCEPSCCGQQYCRRPFVSMITVVALRLQPNDRHFVPSGTWCFVISCTPYRRGIGHQQTEPTLAR